MTSPNAAPDLPDGDWPSLEPGTVWLVGAGPGDPGLVSLHALNGLRQADVIVYDALVNNAILQWAAPDAEILHAGKRGGKPSPKQRDISLHLIELAKAGKRVLRLKGGDPFVFGRGGEEALALRAAGIPFRIVPGITAGIGGLAYAGIPATHRDVNQTLLFLTGHDQSGMTPASVDWAAVAKASPVIVMYMAMKHLDAICTALLEGGRDPDEPLAIITDASLPGQTVVETTLAGAVDAVRDHDLKPPAIICLGRAVDLRPDLNWYSDGQPADERQTAPTETEPAG